MCGITGIYAFNEAGRFHLINLQRAVLDNRNLMTEKYALMDNLITHPIELSGVINIISMHEVEWMHNVKTKYPNVIQDNNEQFVNYMICEYETYSLETLNLLANDVKKAKENNLNLAEMRYNNLFKRLGYKSISDAYENDFR